MKFAHLRIGVDPEVRGSTIMKKETTTTLFRLSPRGEGRWEIRTTDASLVARLTLSDSDTVVVDWIQPRPLPREYSTPRAVLADLVMWENRQRRGTKPIPIPTPRRPGSR